MENTLYGAQTRVRLRSKVLVDASGCWLWQASRNPAGYGIVGFQGKVRLAHRVAYLVFRGDIPDGWTIDHTCRQPACVNPDHLDAVPLLENIARARRGQHPCRGLDHDPSEIYTVPGRREQRCHACDRERHRAARVRRGVGPPNHLKTHCSQGHPYDASNTGPAKQGHGRRCRQCHRESERRRRVPVAPRTQCRNGHPWDVSNTLWIRTARSHRRVCRTCALLASRRRRFVAAATAVLTRPPMAAPWQPPLWG